MEMQPAPVSLSWVGNSCLCQKDAERELIALRGKPIMQTGVLELSDVLKSTARSGGGAEKASGGHHRRRRSSHPPSNNTTTLPEKKKFLTPSTKLTSDEAIVKIQEETEALRQALADKSDYRLAQCSMNRLDGLESALWEAHATETRAAAQLETLELQREQKAEEGALEVDLKEKVDRLREACGQRAFILRREHAAQLDELGRAARSGGGGGDGASAKKAKKAGPSAPCAAQLIQAPTAATLSLVSLHQHQQKRNTEKNHTTAGEEHEQAEQNQKQEKKQEQKQERGEEGGTTCSARQPTPSVAVTVAEASVPAPVLVPGLEPGMGTGVANHARKKEMVDLRDELGRHFAVAHADGGQHLKEATRVMRLIEEVEAQARLEAEAKANSKHDSLERLSLRQKHAQAEDVQQDKHERLLRSLERSRAEQLRLVSARHNGALGRLTERRREKNRRRKHALRERLAAAKGGVARAWKEHNRCLLGAGRASEKRRAVRDNGESLEKCATAAAAEAAAAAAAAAIEVVAAPERGSDLTSMELEASKKRRGGDRSATHSSCLVEMAAAGAAAAAEAAVGVGNQAKVNASKTFIEHTAPSMVVEQVASWEKNVQTKQQSRREATLSPTATTTFPRGRSSNNNRGRARRQQRKRRVTSDTHNDDAPELPTTSPTLATAFVGGAVGVLSEEEVQALAALGRGTPNDPRLLLVASRPQPPPPPSEVGAIDVPREKRDAIRTARDDFGLKTSHHTLRMARDDSGKDSYYHSDGGGRAVGTIRGRGRSVLERAVDKLVPEMRARENLTRRSLGMASLASW